MSATTATQTTIACAECGAPRPPEQAGTVPRPPCPACGATAVSLGVGIAEELDTADEISAGLKPGDQSLGWSRRWEAAQAKLPKLLAVRTGDLSGDAVKEARDELLDFFPSLFHIKDALKVEAASLGLDKKVIEAAVNSDSTLALVGDLTNLVKHHGKDRNPRSGFPPEIGKAVGWTADGGWRLDLPIQHGSRSLDASVLAEEGVDAWRRLLTAWGLI